MPVTISGDGGIAGVSSFDFGNLNATSITTSGNLTAGIQSSTVAALFVDDTNSRVGINTLAPTRPLDVRRDGANRIAIFSTNTGLANLELASNTTTLSNAIGRSGNDLRFYAGNDGTARLTIADNGDATFSENLIIDEQVGIGTSNLLFKLTIVGTNSGLTLASLGQEQNYYHLYRSNTGGQLTFDGVQQQYSKYNFQTYPQGGSVGTSALFIDNNGNIGINTINPAGKLDITNTQNGIATTLILNNFNGANDGGNSIVAARALVLGADYLNNSGTIASYIGFETDATEKMRITAEGRVGIGTDSPDYTFEASSTAFVGASFTNPSATTSQLAFKNSVTDGVRIRSNSTSFQILTQSLVRQTINEDGNVGIGTDDPQGLLDIESNALPNDSSADVILLGDGGIGGSSIGLARYANAQQYGMTFSTTRGGRAEVMRIDQDGNVGIGTDGPQAKLHVFNNQADVEIAISAFQANFSGQSKASLFKQVGPQAGAVDGDSPFHILASNGDFNSPMIFHTRSRSYTNSERMRIKETGIINFANVPTSTTGLVSGDIYRDGSDLKIVP